MIGNGSSGFGVVNPKQALLYTLGATLLTLVLLAGGEQLGPLMVLCSLLLPLPAAYVHLRCGAAAGGAAVVLVIAYLLVQATTVAAGAYLLQHGLGSFLLPFLLRRGWAWDKAAVTTLVVVLTTAGLLLAGYAQSRQLPLTAPAKEYVQKELDRAKAATAQENLTEEQRQEFEAYAQRTADFMLRAYPGMAVAVTGGMLLLLTALLAAFSQGRYEIPGPAFAHWKSPDWLVWLLIPAGFSLVLGDGPLQTLGLNLLVVVLPVYFLHGLAIVTYYFQKRQTPPAWRWLGYVMVTVFTPLPFIVLGIGVFDLWADFRKPRIKKT